MFVPEGTFASVNPSIIVLVKSRFTKLELKIFTPLNFAPEILVDEKSKLYMRDLLKSLFDKFAPSIILFPKSVPLQLESVIIALIK